MERTLIKKAIGEVGQSIKIQGWVDSIRNHGKVCFVDLKDRSGLIQVVLTGELLKSAEKNLSNQSVIQISGLVKKRLESMINPNLETGTIEIEASEFVLLNESQPVPFPLDTPGYEIDEEVRLKYRYLDLRRERTQNLLKLRSKLYRAFREHLYQKDFVEIETPMLTKSTKEGARDFIVPSRFYPGKFYALPQSPQQYKQLLMTAGMERYFQVARCIRDEDLRADRGFEFTQLDIEMSFVTQEDIMSTIEDMVKDAVAQTGGTLQNQTFPIYTYKEAIKQFGADKFDIRNEKEKEKGVLAFAWVIDFPFFKKVDKEDVAEVRDGKSGWTFTHNPFSQPQPQSLEDHLNGENIENILTAQYDLVCNGYEIGGGSVRAHNPQVLKQTFKIMGYTDEQIEESIGHMLKAFSLGTPPHGGIALGLDRLVMLLGGEKSLKETIAFPMSSTGKTAVMEAPSAVAPEQLAELGLNRQTINKKASVTDQIKQMLGGLGIKYQTINHAPVITSEEAAKARNSSIASGAKSMVMKVDGQLLMFVIPGDKKVDAKAIKAHLKAKDVEMAPKDVVEEVTKVQIGGVPPFGSLFELKTYVDETLAENKQIYFNAGSKEISMKISHEDFVRAEQPEVGSFAKV